MAKKIQFYMIDAKYKAVNNVPVVQLFGKTPDGEQIMVQDDSFRPYFYVIPKKGKKVSEKLEKIRVERDGEISEITKVVAVSKKLLGSDIEALKVYTTLPRDIPVIMGVVKEWEIIDTITEYDIPFVKRYLIDKNIVPMTLIQAEGDFIAARSKVPVFKAEDIAQFSDDTIADLRLLSFDIETYSPDGNIDPEKNPIIMLSFYGHGLKRSVTWKKVAAGKDVEFVDSEASLITRFKELVEQHKPDLLVGYNSDNFDLPYIAARAKRYKIRLDIGADYSELSVIRRPRQSVSKIFGRAHFDLYRFISRILAGQLDTDIYGLGDVAKELLGEKKLEVDITRLGALWDANSDELADFLAYNLHDAYLAFRLAEKMLPNLLEMVKIVGLPLFDVSRMAFSQLVESYLLKNESSFDVVSPDTPSYDDIKRRRSNTFKGGFVFEPKPGVYKNIVVFDFRSLYPSIISSHNISPGTYCCECCQDDGNMPPDENDRWFCSKKKGFIPTMMEDLIKRRMRILEIIKDTSTNPLLEARLNALKLLANSFYGYLGFFAARWYSLECVKAITAYGRYYVHKVIDKAQESGFTVVYSDTDSVFLTLSGKRKSDAEKLLEEINIELPGVMELSYEDFYPTGIFVASRSGESGAKKKYALLSEKGSLKIRGFETVRRNWSPIAREVQENVLRLILQARDDQKAFLYIKEVISLIRGKSIENSRLIIRTQLQKDVSKYDSVHPHVAVAARLKRKGRDIGAGSIISYLVTSGSEMIRDRAKPPSEVRQGDYDADYYIKNQIIPAVESIFSVIGYSKEELAEGKGQKKLQKFFKG